MARNANQWRRPSMPKVVVKNGRKKKVKQPKTIVRDGIEFHLVDCLGPFSVGNPHQFYSVNPRRHRQCSKCLGARGKDAPPREYRLMTEGIPGHVWRNS